MFIKITNIKQHNALKTSLTAIGTIYASLVNFAVMAMMTAETMLMKKIAV